MCCSRRSWQRTLPCAASYSISPTSSPVRTTCSSGRVWRIVARSLAEASSRQCPGGADAHLLKSVVHDWDDAATVKILRACRAAVANTGRLLVVEPIIQPGNEPDPAKFSDLNMLVMLGGQERTADDFERLYAEAGFRLSDIIRTGSLMAIIEGVPV